MVARPVEEAGRASTPLELLFDLVFVVAVGRAVSELAHGLTEGQAGRSLISFAMVFFAIWWAWMNFTWFASSYDVDDGPYRLAVMAQMFGVLILAGGLAKAFRDFDWTAPTLGYVVMRLAMIFQWVRAGRGDPPRRRTAYRYAIGIGVVQIGWVARLALDHTLAVAAISFALLAVAEMAVPAWAERAKQTAWHPHHIVERYGLFTLILLGELVAVAVAGVQTQLDSTGLTPGLAAVSLGGLALVFALWWLYFISPMADQLARHRELAFPWGYGHVACFASLALLGAGLEVSLMASDGSHLPISGVAVGYLVSVPVAGFIIGLWGLEAWAWRSWRGWGVLATTVGGLAAVPWLALSPLGSAGAVAACAAICVTLTISVSASSGRGPA
ncbi:MAG: low temperature requirement protein A [Bifidobacteriaceae bacterium]|jgi:low temperature requirement protein LtrA|nr:low temperature requirement protein A [Bifidobacteriaceae bacterium]